MRAHYDFDKMKWRKNPFAKQLKRPITIHLDNGTIAYFKSMSDKTRLAYQNLINLYLRDCAAHHRKIKLLWTARPHA